MSQHPISPSTSPPIDAHSADSSASVQVSAGADPVAVENLGDYAREVADLYERHDVKDSAYFRAELLSEGRWSA